MPALHQKGSPNVFITEWPSFAKILHRTRVATLASNKESTAIHHCLKLGSLQD
jgi:hypothetical protein